MNKHSLQIRLLKVSFKHLSMVGNKPPSHSILQVLATKLVITREIVNWLEQKNIGFQVQFKR
jgi:hypothetical protein